MRKKNKGTSRRRYQPATQAVSIHLWGKKLEPDKITQDLGIKPDWVCRRGVEKAPDGKVIRNRNGKPRKSTFGHWSLDSHVHDNSGILSRIKDILKQFTPKKRQLRRILKEASADLIITIEPHRDLASYGYTLPANLLNEFTSLGINIRIEVERLDEFWQRIEKLYRKGKIAKMLSKRFKNTT